MSTKPGQDQVGQAPRLSPQLGGPWPALRTHVLVHGVDVVDLQDDLDASTGTLVGRHSDRMVCVQVRAKVQGDADGTLGERRMAARTFRLLPEPEHPFVEFEKEAERP